MSKQPAHYMTTLKERICYWTFFVGQNIFYNITAVYISTYLVLQGINPLWSGAVLLVVKIWDAINDPLFGFIFDKIKFKSKQKSLPWLRISTMLIPLVTIILFSIPSFLGEVGKLIWFGVAYVLCSLRTRRDTIMIYESRDLIHWSEPRVLLQNPG